MNTEELWQSVLGELELNLSKANFTTWFNNTFISTFGSDEVVIGVPNMFTKEWLEKKYHKQIIVSLQNLTNIPIKKIVYIVHVKQGGAFEVPDPTQETQNQPAPFQTYEPSAGQEPVYTQNGVPAQEFSLNTKYTFPHFVVGKQNELAHAASIAVSAQLGGAYNPLFIYGGVGLGKTHLLQAIGNEVMSKNPRACVLYATCEKFTNDFITAVRGGQARDFKNRYRNVDLLLIDDIQFLSDKEGTQEEFFHTFNHLHQNNKQIVLTSDRPPKAIPALENRLTSRFECGMMADVGSPDFETRVAILDAKCREKNHLIAREILHHIATVVQQNVRELEGALNKVIAFHQFKNIQPTLDSVKPILASFQPASTRKSITPKQLLQIVAAYFDLPIVDLIGQSREKRLAFPRQIVMYLMREEMKASFPSIGTEIGGRDHTTAMHAYEKITGCLQEDETLQHDLELIRQRLYAI